ncbi:MAG: hypothetical protein KKD36_04560 [Bacteroidetes bacterium]|nr:hypothetical protein [Bacteroidota bacterium]
MGSYNKKWEKLNHCNCWKCREVIEKDSFKDSHYDESWEMKDGCNCKKCREITIKVDCNKEHDKKSSDKKDSYDHNEWIREKLHHLTDTRVSIFIKDGTHAEGTVKDVKKDYVSLSPTVFPVNELAEVFSNSDDTLLEEFQKYFIRLDDISGFGSDLNSI